MHKDKQKHEIDNIDDNLKKWSDEVAKRSTKWFNSQSPRSIEGEDRW